MAITLKKGFRKVQYFKYRGVLYTLLNFNDKSQNTVWEPSDIKDKKSTDDRILR